LAEIDAAAGRWKPVVVTARCLLATLCVGGSTATALAAGGANFGGTARAIAPTAAEAHYKALTGSSPAAKPPADKRAGFRSGWQTSYLKGTTAKPIEAFALIYVYRTAANARRAYTRSCENCSRDVLAEGIRMKFQLRTSAGNTRTVVDITTCRNVYAAIAITGTTANNALAEDAGALAGAIYRKAIARGMTPCAS
jgi:hypothetical protein